MITIAELFPTFRGCIKWMSVFRPFSRQEMNRLEKEYTICTVEKCANSVFRSYKMFDTDTQYTIDGILHRSNGPAKIHHNSVFGLCNESWYNIGLLHRIDGPAVFVYSEMGTIWKQEWYHKGKKIPYWFKKHPVPPFKERA